MRTNFKSNLLIMAMGAILCSRTVFLLIDDPEGPNILVVAALAAIIFLVSLAVYNSKISTSLNGLKRGLATICVQIVIASLLYWALR